MYAILGDPETENVRTHDRQPPGPHEASRTSHARCTHPGVQDVGRNSSLQESVVVGGFGQSYIVASPPSSYLPGTVLNYQSPEARFEGRVGLEADIWGSDARSLKSVRALPSSNRSEVTSTFSGRQLRRWGEHLTPGGLLSNGPGYGLRETASQRASRIKSAQK